MAVEQEQERGVAEGEEAGETDYFREYAPQAERPQARWPAQRQLALAAEDSSYWAQLTLSLSAYAGPLGGRARLIVIFWLRV